MLLINIAGAPGSGKSTIMRKLREQHKTNKAIVVLDYDENKDRTFAANYDKYIYPLLKEYDFCSADAILNCKTDIIYSNLYNDKFPIIIDNLALNKLKKSNAGHVVHNLLLKLPITTVARQCVLRELDLIVNNGDALIKTIEENDAHMLPVLFRYKFGIRIGLPNSYLDTSNIESINRECKECKYKEFTTHDSMINYINNLISKTIKKRKSKNK